MKFKKLLEKSFNILEQDEQQPINPSPTPQAGNPQQGEILAQPEQDDAAKKMQEQIQKSQEKVLDLIKKIISYIKEASTDTQQTKLSIELQGFIDNIEEASLKGTDATSSLSEIEKVVLSDSGKGMYEPKIAGESYYHQWKLTK